MNRTVDHEEQHQHQQRQEASKKKVKAKSMGLIKHAEKHSRKPVYLLLTVIVSAAMLLIQMHIVENHVVESSSLFLSEPISKESRMVHTQTEKRDKCDEIVDNDDDADEDLKPILKLLCKGGYDVSKTSKTVHRSALPKFSDVLDFYGPPKILGFETCSIYRKNTRRKDRHVAPAGMFNTGTNLLDGLIRENCDLGNTNVNWRYDITYQVLWGKHIPFRYRKNRTAYSENTKKYKGMLYSNTLPVVAVRDPYTWMQSMCRQPYSAQFDHNKLSCPNIVPYESDIEAHPRFKKMKYIPVHVKYDKEIRFKYESMAHLWNEWYSEYIRFDNDNTNDNSHNNRTAIMTSPIDFPFIVVRLEDLIFHPETVIPKICECGGGTVNGGTVHQITEIANGYNHAVDTSSGMDSGLLRSIVKYGNISKRRDGYPKFQLKAARDTLDPRLMDLLGYSYEEY